MKANTMKTYEVTVAMTQYLRIKIEAENEDEARQIADDTDGSEFTEIDGATSWQIDSVDEAKA